MKTLIVVTICTMMLSVASYAQGDTARIKTRQDTTRNRIGLTPSPALPAQPLTQPQTQPFVQPQPNPIQPTMPQLNQSTPAGWTPVNNQSVPDNLRQTLSTPQFNGWQNGSMYTNPNNGMYQLRTGDTNNQQIYYFDKDGKMTTSPPHE